AVARDDARRSRPVHSPCHEERDAQHRVRARGALDLALALGAYQRVENRLEPFSLAAVAEGEGAHRGAVERSVGGDRPLSEGGADWRNRLAPGPRQLVSDLVGVDHVHAELREQARNCALAAADAARESDGEGLHRNWLRYA